MQAYEKLLKVEELTIKGRKLTAEGNLAGALPWYLEAQRFAGEYAEFTRLLNNDLIDIIDIIKATIEAGESE